MSWPTPWGAGRLLHAARLAVQESTRRLSDLFDEDDETSRSRFHRDHGKNPTGILSLFKTMVGFMTDWMDQKYGIFKKHRIYPLVNLQFANLNMAIEIVSFRINSMVIFHRYVNVYQRVQK